MNCSNLSTSECVHSPAQQCLGNERLNLRLKSFRQKLVGVLGSSLVEFTVSIPVLFLLLIGFMQMCFAVYSNFCITELARDTARWASVRGSNSCADAPGMPDCNATSAEIQALAQKLVYPGIDSSKISVSTNWLQASSVDPVTWSTCTGSQSICNAPGNAVQVTLSYPLPFQVPFASSRTFSLQSTSQMVIVQ